jgi:hypothetical protein
LDLANAYIVDSVSNQRVPYTSVSDQHPHVVFVVLGVQGVSSFWAFNAPTAEFSTSGGGSVSGDVVGAAPYTGPVVQAPGISSPKRAGEKLTLSGSNLSGVSKVEIAGLDCQVVVNSAGEIEIVVPAGLAAGTYDLVVTSDSGRLVVQSAIVVAGSSAATSSGEVRPSTKRMADNTAKVWVFGVAGSGKVQILVNGREIAWVRTEDSSDSRLTNGYLVRTVELSQGKNVIEIYVAGERVRRVAYTR